MLKALSKIQKTARMIFLVVFIVLLIILFIWGQDYIGYILGGLGGIGALFMGGKAKKAEKLKKQSEDLETRVDDLKSRIEKRRAGPNGTFIILCMIGLLFFGQQAMALYIPDDYETLKQYYIQADKDLQEALDIIAEYQELNLQYQSLIEDYQKPQWGLLGGIDIAKDAQWRLGVARKQGNLSWSAGFIGGNEFGVFCEAIVWWQSPF